CHGDFDGLCAGAKWILGGVEPYPGADADARAIDTRLGEASPTAQRIERALKVRPKDDLLRAKIIHYLVGACEDPKAFVAELEAMGAEALAFEQRARALSERFEIDGPIAFCDARNSEPFDKTALLLLGQERALISVVLDDQSLTVAAPFNSGINLIEILGLNGGMPTRVSLRPSSAKEVMEKLRAWASMGSTK
ncbi:MAG: hypothetical protein N2515_08955, partial [Deltaproteobacteria bacterium]|nr:hypothetical protein [Deltaproteobacteria bacterium]